MAMLVVYWLMLLTGTHWPREIFPQEKPLLANDKLLHFSAYLGLAFLLMLVARLRRPTATLERRAALGQIVAVWLLACAAGLFDEVTQPIFGRDFEWLDWIADATGAFVGAALALVALRLVGDERARAADAEGP